MPDTEVPNIDTEADENLRTHQDANSNDESIPSDGEQNNNDNEHLPQEIPRQQRRRGHINRVSHICARNFVDSTEFQRYRLPQPKICNFWGATLFSVMIRMAGHPSTSIRYPRLIKRICEKKGVQFGSQEKEVKYGRNWGTREMGTANTNYNNSGYREDLPLTRETFEYFAGDISVDDPDFPEGFVPAVDRQPAVAGEAARQSRRQRGPSTSAPSFDNDAMMEQIRLITEQLRLNSIQITMSYEQGQQVLRRVDYSIGRQKRHERI